MNEANYASLEASKRLIDAGIVLETEFVWYKPVHNNNWQVIKKEPGDVFGDFCYPAASMAEVWRELPEYMNGRGHILDVYKEHHFTKARYYGLGGYANANPTDALIDLLIWVRKEATK